MGFIFGDLVLQTIIEEGLEDLRANLDLRLNDFYDQLKSSFLNDRYGQAELDRMKIWFVNNKIDITQSWRMISERVPCINIQIVSSIEDEGKSTLRDFAGDIDVISDGIVTSRSEKKEIANKESIQISVHVNDPGGTTALRWLYAATLFFLISRKEDLLDRGIDISTFSASDFNRLNEFLPENIYSRYITFSYHNKISWTASQPDTLIDNIDISGGEDASYGLELGGIRAESGEDPEYENQTFYTIGKEE